MLKLLKKELILSDLLKMQMMKTLMMRLYGLFCLLHLIFKINNSIFNGWVSFFCENCICVCRSFCFHLIVRSYYYADNAEVHICFERNNRRTLYVGVQQCFEYYCLM